MADWVEQPILLINKDLRFVPKDRSVVEAYIESLEAKLLQVTDVDQRVSVQGEIAAYLNVLDRLESAEALLRDALTSIQREGLGIRREIQQKIRLAHVLQHKREFDKSTKMFEEILNICKSDSDAKVYLDFAYQHSGNNFFDQEKYDLALQAFTTALCLRQTKNAPLEQLDSTTAAIARTRQKMRSKS